MASSYHHGDLPAALRAATVELIAEKGTAGFSLREVARRAGVSHAAPAHHFGDAEGILTSVAAEGFAKLADEMAAASSPSDKAIDRLRLTGAAYLRVAVENPGHFAVMMKQLVDCSDPDLLTHSVRSYDVLLDVMRSVREQHNPDLDIEAAATFTWSSIQGLVALAPNLEQVAKDTGTATAPVSVLVDQFATFMLEGFAAR